MKRQIKFRGKRTDTGEWVFGYYLEFSLCDGEGRCSYIKIDGCQPIKVLPDTVGQLICIIPNTSIYVDNSKELYEDDLFTVGKSNTVYRAVYDGFGEFYGVSNKGDKYGAYTIRFSRDTIKRSNIKIVGNYHDNPELLKGGINNERTRFQF